MATLTLPVADAEFANGEPAQGTEVLSQDKAIRDFLNGGNLDGTDNINMTAVFAWLNRHVWTVTDATNHNLELGVVSVLNASKYGFKFSSAAAQVNSALLYGELSNASSTVPIFEFSDAGSGSTIKVTKSGNGACSELTQSGSANTAACVIMSQAGTGPLTSGTLRSLANLNGIFLAKTLTTAVTIDNTATETLVTDLTTTLPANFLKAGTTIRGKVTGVMATPGAAPATARLRVYYGGVAGVLLLDTGAFTPAVDLVASMIDMDFTLTGLTTGATGTIEAQGKVLWNSNTLPAARGMGTAATGTGNTAAKTIDTTASKDLVVSWTWGTAVSGCTTVLRSGYIEILR